MTSTRYLIARVALAFGISRRQRRMAEAASESHLLREAEQILGSRVWNQVEEIEELGIEYWNLRRLETERKEIREQLKEAESQLGEAQAQRAELLNQKSGSQENLEAERGVQVKQLEELAKERDVVVNQAREVRRLYDGLKTKLEVLKSENCTDTEAMDSTHERMAELRSKFEKLKNERNQLARQIAGSNDKLRSLEDLLEIERQKHRKEASEAFTVIGDANRKITTYKAELGLIETQMQQLFGEIGRHVSRNAFQNPNWRHVIQDNRPMIEVMRALRKSIILNHRLAGA